MILSGEKRLYLMQETGNFEFGDVQSEKKSPNVCVYVCVCGVQELSLLVYN